MRYFWCLVVAVSLAPAAGSAQVVVDSLALARSIDQLRGSVGAWDVTTEFLADDGSVARTAEGSYVFEWVVEDRVVSGVSSVPAVGLRSGILFYVNATKGIIEMVSVGPDGRLWVMTGPLGGETRTTQPYPTADGGTGQLRFTRFNVEPDRFESRMEYSTDGGATWRPGNHQLFRRRAS